MSRDPRKRPAKRTPRPSEPSNARPSAEAPEIHVAFMPAGRETIDAISEDLAGGVDPDSPELEFRLVPAGRETLAAITADVLAESPLGARAPMTTVDYDQREVVEPTTGTRKRVTTLDYQRDKAPKARATSPGVAPPANPAPQKLGRDTLAAIASAVLDGGTPKPKTIDVEAFELVTFVVRGDGLGQLSSEAARRELVAERLLHRLPVASMELVDRVDLTPWTVKGTSILRVWCRVPAPAKG